MNIICGINPVLEALHAGTRHFDRILVVKGLRNRRISEAIARASRLGIPMRFEARETLDRIAGGVPHQGLMAVVSAKPLLDLDGLLGQTRDPAFLVVLDGVEDPRNLGAILRTAEAAGADGVVLPERHSAGLSETTAKASSGAVEYVKVARVGNVAQALEALKARGLWVVGFDASGAERWDTVDLRQPVALVLGGEGRGIRRLVRERCDHLVSLPLFGHLGSLNVSVAAGIAMYEVIRQRGLVPSQVRPIPPRPATDPVRQVVGPSADDAEHDPGNLGHPVASLSHEAEEEDEGPLDLVRIHDEAAWSLPSVPISEAPRHASPRPTPQPQREGSNRRPPHAGDQRGPEGPGRAPAHRRGRRRRWRGAGGQSGPPPTGEPGLPQGEGSGAGPAPEARAGSGRRRRRRRRR